MELTLEFWFLFPTAIAIATIAMASGIGGAVFFSPLFMLVLHLEPKVAIGAALITEFFGFFSGVIAYWKSGLIDYSLARNLLLFSVPAAVVGSAYADWVPDIVLKAVFASGIIFIGYQLYNSWRKEERAAKEKEHRKEFSTDFESELIGKDGKVYHYTVCNKNMGRGFAAIGGVFVGMISVGLAELQEYHLVARCKVPTPVAVGTSIFVVVITVMVASVGHVVELANSGGAEANQMLNIVAYTVPGVIIGGQIGPRLQYLIPEDKMKISISFLFIAIGLFMFYTLGQ